MLARGGRPLLFLRVHPRGCCRVAPTATSMSALTNTDDLLRIWFVDITQQRRRCHIYTPSHIYRISFGQDRVTALSHIPAGVDAQLRMNAWDLIARSLEYVDLCRLALVSSSHAAAARAIIQRDLADFSRGSEAKPIVVINER